MSWNLPDDWSRFRMRCGACGGWYHASGAEVCNCTPCDGDDCNNLIPPGYGHTATSECVDARGKKIFNEMIFCEDCYNDFLCSYCGEPFFKDGELTEDDDDGLKYCSECFGKGEAK